MKTCTCKALFFLAVVTLVAVVAAPAPADMISLSATADGRLISGSHADTKHCEDSGTGAVDVYGNSASGMLQWGVIKFDLNSIPSGQVITSAVLKLTVDRTADNPTMDTTAGVYRITKDLVEANATWNSADTLDPWDTAGGDFVGTTGVRLVNPYATFFLAKDAPAGTVCTIDVINMVGEWYAGTHLNYGMELAAEIVSGQFYRAGFASKEAYAGGGGYPSPVLEVTYVVPEPSTLALLATGLIGLLCYAWRKRK